MGGGVLKPTTPPLGTPLIHRVPQVKPCLQQHQITAGLYRYSCKYTAALPAPKFVTVWRRGPAKSLSRNTRILNFSGINTGYCVWSLIVQRSIHSTRPSRPDYLCSRPELLKARWRARLLHQTQVAGIVWLQFNGKEFENVDELNSLKPDVRYELSVWLLETKSRVCLFNLLGP